jgi:5'-nucleotidase
MDNNCIDSYNWTPVPINSDNCPRDPAIEEVINSYKSQTDAKYGQILTKFVRELTHPTRIRETELGDLFADILKDALGVDIFLMASGSVRVEKLGPVVTKGNFNTCFPYDDSAHLLYWTGAQLKNAIKHMLRDETLEGAHTEFYQLSHGLEVEYDQKTHSFLKFDFEGEPVADDRVFSIGLQQFHFNNMKDSFDLDIEEVEKYKKSRVIASSCKDVIEEKLSEGQHQDAAGTGRLIIHTV